MTSLSLSRRVEAVRPRSAGNFSIEELGIVTTELQSGTLQKWMRFIVIPELGTSAILGTNFIENHIAGICQETGLTTLTTFSFIAIVNETQRDHTVTVSV